MTETIRLGARDFELRPLTLGQLRHLLDALDAMAGKSGGALIDAAVQVVTAGLAASHPDLTADMVLSCEASLAELNAAVAAILTIAGLHPAGEAGSPDGRPPRAAVPGMATAGEIPATGSAPSMAPSPPAAAMPTR
jgi:hypothetical protein